jgi:hypothetical protein
MGAPALTGFAWPAGTLFTTVTFGQFTTILDDEVALPSFEVVTPARLSIAGQVPTVVGELMWTFLL